MPQKIWVPGEEVVADDLNDYLQNQSVPQFASVSARNAGWPTPPDGAMCVTTDTNTLWQRVSTVWQARNPFVAAVQGTANVLGAAPATPTIITTGAVAIRPNRKMLITYTTQAVLTSGAGGLGNWELLRDSTIVQSWGTYISPGGAGNNVTVTFTYVDSPTGLSTVTYLIRWSAATTSAGVDSATTTLKRQLTVIDIGA